TLIEGNYIGTDITGEVVLPTSGFTAAVSGCDHATFLDNVIAKTGAAVFSGQGSRFEGNVIQDNKEGTHLIGGSWAFYGLGPGNTIGGTAAGAGNLIDNGLFIAGDVSVNSIQGTK